MNDPVFEQLAIAAVGAPGPIIGQGPRPIRLDSPWYTIAYLRRVGVRFHPDGSMKL